MVEFIEISLLPEEYQIHDGPRLQKNMVLSFIGASAIVISAFIVFLFFNKKLQSTKAELVRVEKEIAAKKPIQDRILELEKSQQLLTAKRDGLKTINVQRDKWVILMELYSKHLPSNTWLTSLVESGAEPPQITFKGYSGAFGEVAQLLARLENDPMISNVVLHQVSEYRAAGKNGVAFEVSSVVPGLKGASASQPSTTGKKKKKGK